MTNEAKGSIPASAGQPPQRVPCLTREPVYPRECGATPQRVPCLTREPVYPRECGATRPGRG